MKIINSISADFKRMAISHSQLFKYKNVLLLKSVQFFLLCFFHCLFFKSLSAQKPSTGQFSLLNSSITGVTFSNTLTETNTLNILTYQYYYNGAGVAAGDLNNDGLTDLFFCANQSGDKLYLNKGYLHFEDITKTSGIEAYKGWSTGVVLADINADGWLDIYVCRSGKFDTEQRRNKLFINNHDNTFSEKSHQYGLDDASYSSMASFFDYDLDGDLDMFLLNHSIEQHKNYLVGETRIQRDSLAGNKLYKNENGFYKDVSSEAGISGNALNFGLGLSVGDINNDGYADILCTNDYQEQDYLYINNQDGTFTDVLQTATGHTSNFSKGCDISDFNNDGYQDFMIVDMMPEINYRQKILKGPSRYDAYMLAVEYGYFHQVVRNTLQLNNTNGTFSEIASFANVAASDWSWSPLFADFDHDGFQDLHITNGFVRDFTDLDFTKYTYAEEAEKARKENREIDFHALIQKMPSVKVSNDIFQNKGNYSFRNKTKDWGFYIPSFSNGASYADLDNDGDLDLIINNINDEAFIYRNNADQISDGNYLKVQLHGAAKNTFAIGAKITVIAGTKKFVRENFPVRGYESQVDYLLHFGLDTAKFVTVIAEYAGGKTEIINHVRTNQTLQLFETNALQLKAKNITHSAQLFASQNAELNISYTHKENTFIDYKREPLLPHQLSAKGPHFAQADLNADGYLDFYFCGTPAQSGKLFFGNQSNTFKIDSIQNYLPAADETDCTFFDFDTDGDKDLLIVYGGNDFNENNYRPQLFVNDGKGVFTKKENVFSNIICNSKCISLHDIDNDGDEDVFIGGYVIPAKYPLSPESYLLRNDNTGFQDITSQYFLTSNLGMITDAAWADMNNDNKDDLILCGEWMPLRIFLFENNTFNELENTLLKNNSGWWNCIVPSDIDNDGDMDIVAGNQGLNSFSKATYENPVLIFTEDLDQNGSIDPLICIYHGDTLYPLSSRDDLLDQINFLKKRYVFYHEYAEATLDSLFPKINMQQVSKLYAREFASAVYKNTGNNSFKFQELPPEAQFAPLNSIIVYDFNKDGYKDIVAAGNNLHSRPEMGILDAGTGVFLSGDGTGKFKSENIESTGLYIPGQTEDIQLVEIHGNIYLVAAKNNSVVQVIKLHL